MHDLDDDSLRALMPRLRRFAQSLSGDAASADDLVQAALERALRRWSTRRDADALQPWLFAIVYRQFVDTRRRAQRWQTGRDSVHPDAHVRNRHLEFFNARGGHPRPLEIDAIELREELQLLQPRIRYRRILQIKDLQILHPRQMIQT